MSTFIGKVAERLATQSCGFIKLDTVTKLDGSPHDLHTDSDIFIHQDDCDARLLPSSKVHFDVRCDDIRGGDAFRATDVLIQERQLALIGADGKDRFITDPEALYVPPTEAQAGYKPATAEMMQHVLSNKPLHTVERSPSTERLEHRRRAQRELLGRAFPQFFTISQVENCAIDDPQFPELLQRSIADHQNMRMHDQVRKLQGQVKSFDRLRSVLQDEALLPGNVLPIAECLPDLFMAVPVWYFWGKPGWFEFDSNVNWTQAHFCRLIGTNAWVDTFLLFNRRMRYVRNYEGDIIPHRVKERMYQVADQFDYLVIMTPYHDVVARDWADTSWARSVDPYVVGFIKDLPYMFVVDRFSDSGIFPLHSELLADTIEFLRYNQGKLRNFGGLSGLNWCDERGREFTLWQPVKRLEQHVGQILETFEQGKLFEWLKGQHVLPKKEKKRKRNTQFGA